MSDSYCSIFMDTAVPDAIASFPTTGQPITYGTPKDILLSLRASMQSDLLSGLHQYRAEVQELGERVS